MFKYEKNPKNPFKDGLNKQKRRIRNKGKREKRRERG